MTRLPPLASIRAFEASARLMSFTKASEELNITQSAISRHIRHLEDWLGVPLFVRKPRALLLTPEGERYKFELGDMFLRITEATERIASGQEQLHIHSSTTFAMHWLIPRIASFHKLNPGIDLQLTSSPRPVDPDERHVHGVIRVGPASHDSPAKLFAMNLVPVCAPSLIKKHQLKADPNSLRKVPLLHSLAAPANWQSWLNGVGVTGIELDRGTRFESSAMCILAAEKGMGVAVTQKEFITEAVQRGTLALPFPTVIEPGPSFYFAHLSAIVQNSALDKFRRWLLAEARAIA